MSSLAQLTIVSNRIDSIFRDPATLVDNLFSRLLVYAIAISGMYFFVRTLLAGFQYLTSEGEPAKIQAAQQTLIHSLLGLILIITAFFLAQIIQTIFGLKIVT